MHRHPWRAAVLATLLALTPSTSRGQVLPSEPITVFGGRLTIGGEASVSTSTNADELGWFNYTDYEHNALRMIRLGATAEARLGSRLSILGELRTENWDRLRPYALYVRVRPWVNRHIDIQAGRIPPTFGAFARRDYSGTDNPLIGYPLAYQYLIPLRPDAVPGNADDLLRMRGRGWRPSFPVGSTAVATGVPLITAFQWDTGVQVHLGSERVEVSAAVTTGTLSAPHVRDDNAGKQLVGRLAWHPVVGLTLGASAARGPYLADSVTKLLPASVQQVDFTQQAYGFDVEYSRDYWVLRSEGVVSQWRVPVLGAPRIDGVVQARSISIEGRYKLRPGMFAAGRYDYLGFSNLQGSTRVLTWDAPVTRVEAGGGYYLLRNLIAKVTYQHDWRDSEQVRRLSVWSGQVQFWF